MLADQTDDINASISALNRMAGQFAGQYDTITRALDGSRRRWKCSTIGNAPDHYGAG